MKEYLKIAKNVHDIVKKSKEFYSEMPISMILHSNSILDFEIEVGYVDDDNITAFFTLKDNKKYIFINAKFIKKLFEEHKIETKRDKIMFLIYIIYHELSHGILNHTIRFEKYAKQNHILTNIGLDLYIDYILYNITLKEYYDNIGFGDKINKTRKRLETYKVLLDDELDKTNEHFYKLSDVEIVKKLFEILKDSNDELTSSSDFDDKNGTKQKKYKYDPKGDTFEEIKDEKEFPNDASEDIKDKNEQGEFFKPIDEKVVNVLKNIGKDTSTLDKILKDIKKIDRDWKEMLRNSLKNVFSKKMYYNYKKPNKKVWGFIRKFPGKYIPLINRVDTVPDYGDIVVSVDESASMTDVDIENIISALMDFKKYYKNIHIIVHDSEISFYKVYDTKHSDKILKDIKRRRAFGGTSHKMVFEKVSEINKKEKVALFVMATDGYSDIESYVNMIDHIKKIILYAGHSHKKVSGIYGIELVD